MSPAFRFLTDVTTLAVVAYILGDSNPEVFPLDEFQSPVASKVSRHWIIMMYP
jgi:hypothetical protein